MTKHDELAKLHGFISTLPDSYLRDMLAHIAPQFESDTIADMPCMPDVHAMQQDINETRKQLDAERTQLATVQQQVKATESRLSYLREMIAGTISQAHVAGQRLLRTLA